MVALPATCTRCGHTWQPNAIAVGDGSTGNTFIGNTTNCPQCGGLAKILEGTINVRAGAIEMVEGPQWSWDLVDQLKLTLRRIVEEKPADPVAAIAAVSPEIAAQVEQATSGMSTDRILTLISLLHAALFADYSNINALAAAVRYVLDYALNHPGLK